MKGLDDKDKGILIIARFRLRLGIILFVFAILLLASQIVPDDLFKNSFEVSNKVVAPSTTEEFVYEPIVFDESECENGIHIPSGMVVDTGCAEVVQNCGACHSLDLVKQNRATKEGWLEIIDWMQETQKLWDLGVKEEVIVNYLAKYYGPENSGRRKNLENIEWYNL